ncbi:MAG: aminoacyl-histidine dipeptidase [Bacteroidales bacterium]|jgi:dipeptidase D|nr:aminoacyl-histidine dipeptidase [Bacteroidales bacterium]
MSNNILNLQPTNVWKFFYEICQIPRPSKKEDKIMAYLMEKGKSFGLETLQDEAGNVLIRKPATKGKEHITPIVFQSHADMVCESNSAFDFENNAIEPWIDGEWVRAKGTTLGADDGIGMAIALALLEDKTIEHGAIECLFTVDEESGMTGAFGLKSGFMNGKMLLNLDSEDEGQFFIGCAGGKSTTITIENKRRSIPKELTNAFEIKVKGLKGGHSGDDINKGRGNAIKILNRVLYYALYHYNVALSTINGGKLHNAIAREASAIVLVEDKFKSLLQAYVKEFNQIVKNEYFTTDSGVEITISEVARPKDILDDYIASDLIDALYACPHGVIAMAQDIENFVETSTNLASIKMEGNQIKIITSQRSSVESKKEDVGNMVEAVFGMIDADIESSDGYPGWTPNPKSVVLDTLRQAYKNLYQKEPAVLAIHAGLECGLISEKYPDMDMISYGPTLRDVHSPDERLLIVTVQQVWDLTKEFLKILK